MHMIGYYGKLIYSEKSNLAEYTYKNSISQIICKFFINLDLGEEHFFDYIA